MSKLELERMGELVHARLLVAPQAGLTRAELRKALNPWWGDERGREPLDATLAAEREAGRLAPAGRRWTFTSPGRLAALDGLGLPGLAGGVRFETLVNGTLVPKLLGLPADLPSTDRKRVASTEGLRALLVARAAGLELGRVAPSASEARRGLADARLRQALGLAPRGRGPLPRIQGPPVAMVLSAEVGAREVLPVEKAFSRLAARAAGSDRALSGRGLRKAIVRRWLSGDPPVARREGNADGPETASAAPTVSRALGDVLRHPTGGVYGRDRLFIAAAFDQLLDRMGSAAPSREAFDFELLRLAREGAVTLSRADYVEAMDPELVRRSRVDDRGAERHFIVLERGASAS